MIVIEKSDLLLEVGFFFESKCAYIFKNPVILLFLENKRSYICKNPKWVNKVSMSLQDNFNEKTKAALREVEEMKANPSMGKSYTDVDAMMRVFTRTGTHSGLFKK